MKKSFFQLIDQNITNIEFIKNEKFKESEIELEFSHKVNVERGSNNKSRVTLDFYISKKESLEKAPFYINVEIKGIFEWFGEVEEDTLCKLLNENAPAILLSYIRSLVTQITAFSGYPALIIPLLNFTEE